MSGPAPGTETATQPTPPKASASERIGNLLNARQQPPPEQPSEQERVAALEERLVMSELRDQIGNRVKTLTDKYEGQLTDEQALDIIEAEDAGDWGAAEQIRRDAMRRVFESADNDETGKELHTEGAGKGDEPADTVPTNREEAFSRAMRRVRR